MCNLLKLDIKMKKRVYICIEWLVKNWLRIGGVLITLTLLFAAFSCSPSLAKQEKRAKKLYFKAIKLYPALIDSSSKTDTGHQKAEVNFTAENPITQTEIDSLLAEYCQDTTIYIKVHSGDSSVRIPNKNQSEIKRKIQDRCTIESLRGYKAKVFNVIGGTITVTAKGNEESVAHDIKTINTETTYYMPNEKCEEEKERMEKAHKKELWNNRLTFTGIGMFLMLLVLILLRILMKSGGLR